MKILITGARGNFPLALVPRLLSMGNQLVLFDLEPMLALEGCISVQADIRDAAAVLYAMQGCDAVIHAVAYNSVSSEFRNDNDFYGVNITGTQNVLRAMLLCNIKHLVFSSTDEVCGTGLRGLRTVTEDIPSIPMQIFGLTKHIGEELCRYYSRVHGLHIAILRYGKFSPADWKVAGMGRLNNWLDREDVAQANELALGAVIAEEFKCETFLIQSAKPFIDSDWPELEHDPAAGIERHYPGAAALLGQHRLSIPRIHQRYDITKAVAVLGYDPQHNFEQFLGQLRRA